MPRWRAAVSRALDAGPESRDRETRDRGRRMWMQCTAAAGVRVQHDHSQAHSRLHVCFRSMEWGAVPDAQAVGQMAINNTGVLQKCSLRLV